VCAQKKIAKYFSDRYRDLFSFINFAIRHCVVLQLATLALQTKLAIIKDGDGEYININSTDTPRRAGAEASAGPEGAGVKVLLLSFSGWERSGRRCLSRGGWVGDGFCYLETSSP
jgi:hypothetical protein